MACKQHCCFGRRYVTTVLRDQSVIIWLSGRCEIRCIKSNHSPTLQHWGGTNETRLHSIWWENNMICTVLVPNYVAECRVWLLSGWIVSVNLLPQCFGITSGVGAVLNRFFNFLKFYSLTFTPSSATSTSQGSLKSEGLESICLTDVTHSHYESQLLLCISRKKPD